MYRRISALLLTLIMLLGLLPMTLSAAEPGERLLYETNFDNTPPRNDYASDLTASQIGASGLYDHSMQITRTDAIERKSARIAYANWTHWGLNRVDKHFILTADLKFYEGAEHEIYLVLGSNSDRTGNFHIAEDAWIVKVQMVDGKPCLYSREEKIVYTFEYGEVYNLRLDVPRGAGTYDITVNDTLVADDVKHIDRVGAVLGTRWAFKNCDVMFDNFQLRAIGREYPAEYSTQAPGEMPEFDYPETYVYDGVYRVYHNTVRQDFSASDVVVNDAADEAYLNAEKVIPLVKGDAEYTCENGVYKVTDGDKTLDITGYITDVNGIPMLSLTDINQIFGAKVWLDNTEHMVLLTTGSYMNDNFLRACGYRFVMNGEPYYELSFNMYDLTINLWNAFNARGEGDTLQDYLDVSKATTNTILETEKEALKALQDNGFHTVRVFVNNAWSGLIDAIRDPEGQATYFECMDFALDLCDQYGIRVIMSLMLNSDIFLDYERLEDGTWYNTGDTVVDMIADPDSASRQAVYDYLDAMIGRYKDRDTVLMWEVSNEMNLQADLRGAAGGVTFSALQLGDFYADITEYIRSIDQNHLVDTGDAILRGQQYSLLEETLIDGGISWRADTLEEKGKILYIINHGIDVVSSHTGGAEFATFYEETMAFCRTLDKPFYLGETSSNIGESGDISKPDSFELQKEHLQYLLECGVQLSTWWDYHAAMDPTYVRQWNVTLETTPDLFYAIADTNRKIQEKWIVNGIENADATPYDCLLSNKVPFTDVPEDAWYYGDVVTAYQSGLVNGTSATTYEPAKELVYSEAVKLAACMNQKTYEGVVTLTVGNPWYQPYVDYASANGIIAGEYDWNAKATRAGYLSIFANALKDADLAPINEVPDGSIPDVPMTHPQADAIYKLYRAGIIQGTDEAHNCSPDTNISRSEMAAILTRMMDATKRVSFTMG